MVKSKYIGKKIDLLTFKSLGEKKDTFVVECECGKICTKYISNIRLTKKLGNIVSCGCKKGENVSNKLTGKPSWRKMYFTEEQIDEMVNLYNQKINLRKIGKVFGVSDPVIKIQLETRGVIVKQRRYEPNKDYFKTIDSEEKAYWLGFLGADGCINRRVNQKGKTRGDSIVLKLSIQDEEHLKKFRDSISPESKITYGVDITKTRKGNISKSNNCRLAIYSNEIVQDIMNLGIHPRKTFTIDKPNIEPKYYRHFIRGFFDGDGTCYTKKVKGKRNYDSLIFRYVIATASHNLRNFFIEELKNNGIDSKSYDDFKLTIMGGYIGSKRFFDYMYNDSTIYLKRKYDKGIEIMDIMEHNKLNGLIKEYVYNPEIKKPNSIWSEDEIKILYDTNDKIPYTYLSGTQLPNKSKQQICKMRKKLGLKSTKQKMDGYLKIRKEIKGY